MRVFINALSAGNRSGTGRYAGELCRALARIEGEDRFVCLVEEDAPFRQELEGSAVCETIALPRRGPLLRSVWEASRLPALVRRTEADLFHAPAFLGPRRLPCPSVVTLHDCAFLRYPETIRPARRLYYRRAIPRSARDAALVSVDSESTRRDAVELLGLDTAKLRVVPLGVGEEFFAGGTDGTEEMDNEREARLREWLGIDGPFLLTVGTIEPRKNLGRLLEAYALLRGRISDVPPLVIAGRRGWLCRDLEAKAEAMGLADHVRFPGFVPSGDLPALLAMAPAFVCVSLYEGFGLPALEAMAAGAPVVVSDTSSLPEVVGDAGRLVDPTDPEAIAVGLADVLTDGALRRRLREEGRRRARTFTWRRVAEETLRLYHEAVAAP